MRDLNGCVGLSNSRRRGREVEVVLVSLQYQRIELRCPERAPPIC
jgi:hypothetical protein